MSGDAPNWVRFDLNAWFRSAKVRRMPMMTRALYLLALVEQAGVGSVPGDLEAAAIALGGRVEDLEPHWSSILELFELGEDGQLRNPRMLEELERARERVEKARAAGSLGGQAKAGKKRKASGRLANARPTLSDRSSDPLAPLQADAKRPSSYKRREDKKRLESASTLTVEDSPETEESPGESLVSEKSPRSGTVSSPRDPKGSDARGARSPAGAGETSKPKRRRKKSKTATKPKRTPPHLEFAEWFAERFEATRGVPYAITGPCRTAASRALKLAGGRLQDAQERAERLLGTSDAWLAQRATLSTLASRWNELAVEVQPLTPRQALRERNRRGLADWARQNTP